jgi:hypothetical protein
MMELWKVEMRKIGYITWGNASQIRSFRDFSSFLDDILYLKDLGRHDLTRYAAIIVPDVMDCAELLRHAQQLNEYVRAGGFLIVFAVRGIEELIDVVTLKWHPVNARDWLWWTKPKPYLEVLQPEPKHPLCEAVPLRDMSWHWLGGFEKHPAATHVLTLDDDSLSLFMDFQQLTGGGRLMVTTLDPHGHNGERFMPATTRFLEGFYPWLNRELGIKRPAAGYTVTYLQALDSPWDWEPPGLAETFAGTAGVLRYHPLYELNEQVFWQSDILYLPNNTDEIFLQTHAAAFLRFLERGGHLVLSSQPAIAWLPFLSLFHPVPPRPFTNLKVRLRQDPLGFFINMGVDFDGWQGIFGQYARGWTDMPEGAVWLTDVGPADDPKPADWVWQYPTHSGRGGYVFMHNGDNLVRYPDHGPHRQGLLRDICAALMRAAQQGYDQSDQANAGRAPLMGRSAAVLEPAF